MKNEVKINKNNIISFIPQNEIFNQRKELLKNGKELQKANIYLGCNYNSNS